MPVRRIPASVGLVTDPSALAVPVGAMREATNVIMHRGVLQPRPGFGDLDGIKEPAPVTGAQVIAIFPYAGDLVVQSLVTIGGTYRLDRAGVAAGNYSLDHAPFDTAIRGRGSSVTSRGSLYLTCDEGIRKLDQLTTSIERAGVFTDWLQPYTLSIFLTPETTAARASLPANTDVAYRYVWRREDVNGYVRRSSPSSRWTQINDTPDPRLLILERIYLPLQIGAGDFFELYRSAGVPTGTTTSDELFLAVEYVVTAADVAAGYIESSTIVDDIPPAQLGAALYTNPSQGGITNRNDPPPIATSIADWGGVTWYGNTQENYSVLVELMHVYSSTDSASDQVGLHYSSRTGDFTVGSDVIAAVSGVDGLKIDQYVSDAPGFQQGPLIGGPHIPALTKITLIESAVTVNNATLADGDTITIGGGMRVLTWRAAAPGTDEILIGPSSTISAGNLRAALDGLDLTLDAGTGFVLSASAAFDTCVITETNGHGVEVETTGTGQTVLYSVTMSANAFATGGAALFDCADWITVDGVEFYGDVFGSAIAPTTNPIPTANIQYRVWALGLGGGLGAAHNTALGISNAVNAYGIVHDPTFNVRVYRDNDHTLGGASVSDGMLVFLRETAEQTSFSVQCTVRPEAFRPRLAEAYESPTVRRRRGRLFWSKLQEPEAVPPLSSVDVGEPDRDILALVPLRSALLVWKSDGLFRVTGTGPRSWVVDELDLTIRLVAPDATCVLDDVCYAWTDRGVVAVTEAGVASIISSPIAHALREFQRLLPADEASPKRGFWMQAHRRLGLVILNLATAAVSDTSSGGQYVWSKSTGAWSTWTRLLDRASAYDFREDRMVVGYEGADWSAFYERSDEDAAASYRDQVATVLPTWNSATEIQVPMASIPWTPTACDVLQVFSEPNTFPAISSVVASGPDWIITLDPGGFVGSLVRFHEGYSCSMLWQAQHLPGFGSRWTELHAELLDGSSEYLPTWTLDLGGQGDRGSTPSSVQNAITSDVLVSRPVRCGMPRETVRATHLYPYAHVCAAGVLWRIGELELRGVATSRRVAR